MKTPVKILIVCGTAACLAAHDMYLMPSTFRPARGATLTIGFHVGDSFPESEVSGRIDRLRDAKLAWQGGSAPVGELRVEGKRNVGDVLNKATGEAIASARTIPNLIELAPAKFAEYLREEGLTPVIDWRAQHGETTKPGRERYSKYARAVLVTGEPNGFALKPTGFPIEILPEKDPYTLTAGDSLPIRVLFQGKPAADLQIESSWSSRTQSRTSVAGRTGTDGRLKVPLPGAGRWRLHTIKMVRCTEPAVADWESFWASLTFDIS